MCVVLPSLPSLQVLHIHVTKERLVVRGAARAGGQHFVWVRPHPDALTKPPEGALVAADVPCQEVSLDFTDRQGPMFAMHVAASVC